MSFQKGGKEATPFNFTANTPGVKGMGRIKSESPGAVVLPAAGLAVLAGFHVLSPALESSPACQKAHSCSWRSLRLAAGLYIVSGLPWVNSCALRRSHGNAWRWSRHEGGWTALAYFPSASPTREGKLRGREMHVSGSVVTQQSQSTGSVLQTYRTYLLPAGEALLSVPWPTIISQSARRKKEACAETANVAQL